MKTVNLLMIGGILATVICATMVWNVIIVDIWVRELLATKSVCIVRIQMNSSDVAIVSVVREDLNSYIVCPVKIVGIQLFVMIVVIVRIVFAVLISAIKNIVSETNS